MSIIPSLERAYGAVRTWQLPWSPVLIVCALGILAAIGSIGLSSVSVAPAVADSTARADTEAELRAAFADPQVVRIAVAADITLTCAGGGALRRDSRTGLVVSGGGHVLMQSCAQDRIMSVEGEGSLTVEFLTLTGGRCDAEGGAIFAAGDVTVVESTLHGNTSARQGGAIYSAARLTIEGSTLRNNGAGLGGGAVAARDDIRVVASRFHDNRGDVGEFGRPYRDACTPRIPSGPWETYGAADGGAIRGLRNVEVADSILRDNSAGRDGGAILAERDIALLRSQVIGNSATNAGGALRAFGGAVITDSAITGNRAGSAGGALQSFRAATVIGSTLNANQSGGSGGAIISGADVLLENVTVTGNKAGGTGGGVAMEAGGDLVLRHATVVENEASAGANLALGRARLVPSHSVVALPLGGPNCRSFAGVAASGGFNVSDDESCGLWHETDRLAVDVILGPLENNGGPTQTRLPAVGSALIDAVPLKECDATVVVDQRGMSRPEGAGCDIGATEIVPADELLAVSENSSVTRLLLVAGAAVVAAAGVLLYFQVRRT